MVGPPSRELHEMHDRSTKITRFITRDAPWIQHAPTEVSATVQIMPENPNTSVWCILVISPQPERIHETVWFLRYADLLSKIYEKHQLQQRKLPALIFYAAYVLGRDSGYQLFWKEILLRQAGLKAFRLPKGGWAIVSKETALDTSQKLFQPFIEEYLPHLEKLEPDTKQIQEAVFADPAASPNKRKYECIKQDGRITFASRDEGTPFANEPQAVAQIKALENHAGLHRWHLIYITPALVQQLDKTHNYLACASLLGHVVAHQPMGNFDGHRPMLMVQSATVGTVFERLAGSLVSNEGALRMIGLGQDWWGIVPERHAQETTSHVQEIAPTVRQGLPKRQEVVVRHWE